MRCKYRVYICDISMRLCFMMLHLLFICIIVYRRRCCRNRSLLTRRWGSRLRTRGSRLYRNCRGSRCCSTTCKAANDLIWIAITETSVARWTMTAVIATGFGIADTGFTFAAPSAHATDTGCTTGLASASAVTIVTACYAVTDTVSATNLISASAATIVTA